MLKYSASSLGGLLVSVSDKPALNGPHDEGAGCSFAGCHPVVLGIVSAKCELGPVTGDVTVPDTKP